jgi:hypothetical protein
MPATRPMHLSARLTASSDIHPGPGVLQDELALVRSVLGRCGPSATGGRPPATSDPGPGTSPSRPRALGRRA